MSSDAKRAANTRYLKTLAAVTLRMAPEDKAALQAHAESRGESVNGFIIRLIKQEMEGGVQNGNE